MRFLVIFSVLLFSQCKEGNSENSSNAKTVLDPGLIGGWGTIGPLTVVKNKSEFKTLIYCTETNFYEEVIAKADTFSDLNSLGKGCEPIFITGKTSKPYFIQDVKDFNSFLYGITPVQMPIFQFIVDILLSLGIKNDDFVSQIWSTDTGFGHNSKTRGSIRDEKVLLQLKDALTQSAKNYSETRTVFVSPLK